jgi:signal transduction histidine kinase
VTRRLTVTQGFGLIVGLLMVVAVAGLVVGLLGLARLSERRDLLADRIDPAQVAALRLSSALLNEQTGVSGYVLGREDAFLGPYRTGRDEEAAAVRQLESFARHDALRDVRADLGSIVADAETWRAQYAEPAIAAVGADADPPLAAAGRDRFDAVRGGLARLQQDLAGIRADAREELDDTATLVTLLFAGAGLLFAAAIGVAALTLRRVVLVPLAQLGAEVRKVAHGEFERPVGAGGAREIAALAEDVDAMRGRIVAEVSALRDAERALVEQARELQRSNEELEQFAYVASHDLQEPLRKVASFTQMLERRYKGQLDERADRYIAFAVDGAKRMQELINDLLEFSRVGRMTAPHERVEIAALVEEAKRRLATAIAETDAVVVTDGLPVVTGDAGLLTAVFQNLISNAIKFRGDKPPRVTIAATREGRFWRFTVTDCGIGVEDEYAERIFVIFQRLHSRDTFEGTGIGLAMCRKIIEYHGGSIWLAPAAPDRGAQFTFTLPARDPEEDPAP